MEKNIISYSKDELIDIAVTTLIENELVKKMIKHEHYLILILTEFSRDFIDRIMKGDNHE